MNKQSVFILGAGGHAKVLIDCLKKNKYINILGIVDVNEKLHGKSILGIPVVGEEDKILKNYPPSQISLVNGIGSIGSVEQRKKIFNRFKQLGYRFLSVIHPTAYIGQEVSLGEGVQIMAGSVIQPGCSIGDNVIVNTRSSLDHDCFIDNHVHVAPGVVCCGSVRINQATHIGSGAVILQGIKVGERCLIAAGAVVIHDVIENKKVAGVPAKIME